ncbi:DNA recombination protein RmuC [Parapedobacter koreensis]|uniref:DNA recombination protein RmuC n=1 Tax=Parapedobacter koreensis TaxID=332977 RepID=A0A1H7QTZ4_9SPHI|nr:DNA recombination protein RmuC [Parapedobacter koreensis]SEL50777.1 DNA recombination protein RmuC [Parapedobacter koreensis]
MELYLVVIAVVILAIAVLLFIKRPQHPTHSPEQELLRKEKEALALQLARAEQQVQNLISEKEHITTMLREEQQRLIGELQQERERLAQAERSLESARAYYKSQQEKLQEQKAEIETIKQQFNTEFQVIANRILEEKTQKFTETNSKNLDQILNPLKEKIKTFEEKVEKTYQTEAAERNTLKGVVEQLMEQSLRIKDEANSLTRALRGDSKKQGNWGEVILERVLERSGLVKDSEYRLQASITDEEGRRLQPDAIIDLPDEKHLVVDSKVSLLAYERWVNAMTDEERDIFAKQHIQSVENHVKGLSAKNYHDLYHINSPDFVLLFMPIESAFSMSITYKADLFSDAWDRKVVIVSPSTLLATLRTIASMWKQERQTRNVLEIAKEAGALYDKFVGFLQDMDRIGEQLNRAVRAHDEATKKLGTGPGNVIKKIENLKKLGAKASKQIDNNLLDEGD